MEPIWEQLPASDLPIASLPALSFFVVEDRWLATRIKRIENAATGLEESSLGNDVSVKLSRRYAAGIPKLESTATKPLRAFLWRYLDATNLDC